MHNSVDNVCEANAIERSEPSGRVQHCQRGISMVAQGHNESEH